jgi:hypothetical protein
MHPFQIARPSPLVSPRLSLCCACKYRVAMYGRGFTLSRGNRPPLISSYSLMIWRLNVSSSARSRRGVIVSAWFGGMMPSSRARL